MRWFKGSVDDRVKTLVGEAVAAYAERAQLATHWKALVTRYAPICRRSALQRVRQAWTAPTLPNRATAQLRSQSWRL